jgi:hypothetical protein
MIRKSKIFRLGFFLLLTQFSFSQLKLNTNTGTGSINTNSAFLDASSSPTWNATNNLGKGLLFPKVDLITLVALSMSGGKSATNNPNLFDGMLVYNTATGISGIGAISVVPGFYYYSNPSTTNVNGGSWLAVSNSSSNAISAKTANYTVLSADNTILCNTVAGAFTLSLPAASTLTGKVYVLRLTDVTSNNLTFSPPLKLTASISVATVNYPKTIRIQSDGVDWTIIE